jgi:hypothetical protein
MAAFVEQDRVDLARREVYEPRRDEEIANLDPFRGQQCARRSGPR